MSLEYIPVPDIELTYSDMPCSGQYWRYRDNDHRGKQLNEKKEQSVTAEDYLWYFKE